MAEEIRKEENTTTETTNETVKPVETAEDTVKEVKKEEQTVTLEENVKKPEEAERLEKGDEKVAVQKEDKTEDKTEEKPEEKIDGYVERKRLLFFGLPWTFTKYTIKEDLLTIQNGLLRTEENDCYMYKIQDVKLVTTLIERLFGLGTVICYTGDVSNPEIHLEHIKHARDVKNYILKVSEEARIKRRTLNTMDISAIVDDDVCECDHTHIE